MANFLKKKLSVTDYFISVEIECHWILHSVDAII